MLARRFSILCLIIAAFGLLTAHMVTSAHRDETHWRNGYAVPQQPDPVFRDGFDTARR